MKKLSLLTLCLIAFIGIVSAQQTQKDAAPNRYGWNETGLWGSVFTITDLYGDVQCVKFKVYNDHRLTGVEYFEFNDNGDAVYRKSFYEKDKGKIKHDGFQQFEYNDSGNIVKVKSKDRRNFKFWIRVLETFEYNDNNELICECVYRGSGKEVYKYRYFYDNNGNKVLQSWYDNKDNLTKLTIYTYDSNNNLVSECNFDENHNLVSRYDYIYEYDGNNNLCEKKAYNDGIISAHIVYYTDGKQTIKENSLYNNRGEICLRSKYNSIGDMVERRTFDYDFWTYPANVINTVEYEYDSHNNIVKTTEYTRKNDEETPRIVSVCEYEYDSHNNIVKSTESEYRNNAELPDVWSIEYEITYR